MASVKAILIEENLSLDQCNQAYYQSMWYQNFIRSSDGSFMFYGSSATNKIYRSDDGGSTWSTFVANINVDALLYHEDSNTLYAVFVQHGVQNYSGYYVPGWCSSSNFIITKINGSTGIIESKTVPFITSDYGLNTIHMWSADISSNGIIVMTSAHLKDDTNPHYWAYKEGTWDVIDSGNFTIGRVDTLSPTSVYYETHVKAGSDASHIVVLGTYQAAILTDKSKSDGFRYTKKIYGNLGWDVFNEIIADQSRISGNFIRLMLDSKKIFHIVHSGAMYTSRVSSNVWRPQTLVMGGSVKPYNATMLDNDDIMFALEEVGSDAVISTLPYKSTGGGTYYVYNMTAKLPIAATGISGNLTALSFSFKNLSSSEMPSGVGTKIGIGNTRTLCYFSPTVDIPKSIPVTIYSGWNLIGIPVNDQLIGESVDTMIIRMGVELSNPAAIEDVWIFDPTAGTTFEACVKKYSEGQLDSHIINKGNAYFIKSNTAGIITFVGKEWKTASVISLKKGHNWINLPSGDYLTPINLLAKAAILEVQKFDGAIQMFKSSSGFLKNIDGTFSQGCGLVVVADYDYDLPFSGISWQ